MAKIDELIRQVPDFWLRTEFERELAELRRRKQFGLVFEEHIPEVGLLAELPVTEGALVQLRNDPNGHLFRVRDIIGTHASLDPVNDPGEAAEVLVDDLVVVKRLGDAIYPTISPLESVELGGPDKPYHAVINGENYYALQLLVHVFERQVDCIYLDPPYNTGARDWKYNNCYVDGSDGWRHSKWLSFMEKRLVLAKRLLRPDGVLIITIDEHELYHLGMLLEHLFPEYRRYKISIVVNASGNTGTRNFGVIDEQALFCVPDLGHDVITGTPAEANGEEDDGVWEHARRRGGGTSYRHQRPRQFYPIYIDEKWKRVVRVGAPIPLGQEPDFTFYRGLRPVWPIDSRGLHRVWCYSAKTMQEQIDKGDVGLGMYKKRTDTWTIRVRRPKPDTKRIKTVWWNPLHNAGVHGTAMLADILGDPGRFPFPKSVYAVRDTLAAVVRNRPQALIVDFFAGSGTTLHACCLLNAEDGGTRRTILVTNNEVDEGTVKTLNQMGYYRGHPEFEKHGIFELATRPRCISVVTGLRPDGTPISGEYDSGRAFAEGFRENILFFRLDYLDPDDIALGTRFNALFPVMALAAGGVSDNCKPPEGAPYWLPENARSAFLFKESRFVEFQRKLRSRNDITHVFLVTDSEEAYAEMCSQLPSQCKTVMLYQDYLRHFRAGADKR